MTDNYKTTAGILYRFFSGFSGFGADFPLGFEAVSPGGGAVFSMEPSLSYRTKYINGGGILRGVCSVTLLCRDHDRAARTQASMQMALLSDYVSEHGEHIEDDTDPGAVFRIYPAASPARLITTQDGAAAAWKLTFTFEKTK